MIVEPGIANVPAEALAGRTRRRHTDEQREPQHDRASSTARRAGTRRRRGRLATLDDERVLPADRARRGDRHVSRAPGRSRARRKAAVQHHPLQLARDRPPLSPRLAGQLLPTQLNDDAGAPGREADDERSSRAKERENIPLVCDDDAELGERLRAPVAVLVERVAADLQRARAGSPRCRRRSRGAARSRRRRGRGSGCRGRRSSRRCRCRTPRARRGRCARAVVAVDGGAEAVAVAVDAALALGDDVDEVVVAPRRCRRRRRCAPASPSRASIVSSPVSPK